MRWTPGHPGHTGLRNWTTANAIAGLIVAGLLFVGPWLDPAAGRSIRGSPNPAWMDALLYA